ncbi:MAG TPA: hypothetical protein VN803_03030 [Gemmatimonadales bacterium]|nr:hypothetical protein [Gemmatimonadales bacterium]
MSTSQQIEGTTVQLPAGVKHAKTTCSAGTWDAYDALSEVDGWREVSWWHDREGKPCSPTVPLSKQHVQKETTVGDHRIVVFRPYKGRAEREAA